jgi:hypothetical protein
VLKMPSHTSNRFQPLDVSFFAPENSFLGHNRRLHLQKNPGKKIDQWSLLNHVIVATQDVMRIKNTIPNGFRKANLFPFKQGDHWIKESIIIFAIRNQFSESNFSIPSSLTSNGEN